MFNKYYRTEGEKYIIFFLNVSLLKWNFKKTLQIT